MLMKSLYKLLTEISTLFVFCGGHFEFCQYKKCSMMTGCHDFRVSSIELVISRVLHTRINMKTFLDMYSKTTQAPNPYSATRLYNDQTWGDYKVHVIDYDYDYLRIS